jgi:hypothetical protein
MSEQLTLTRLPVADPAWAEEIEAADRRERQLARRLEIVAVVKRLTLIVDVTTRDVVRTLEFEGAEYLMLEPDEAPEAWRTCACRLRDAARAGLLVSERSVQRPEEEDYAARVRPVGVWWCP